MSKVVDFELDREGVKDFMRSAEVQELCETIASQVCASLGDGYEVDTFVGETRANASVGAVTPHAYYSNLKHNTILKAVQGVKLE